MTHFNFESSIAKFKDQADWMGLRFYREKSHDYFVRNERLESCQTNLDQGIMIEVVVNGHLGYAATSDMTSDGIKQAFLRAKSLSQQAAPFKAAEFSNAQRPPSRGKFQSPYLHRLNTLTTDEIMSVLLKASQTLKRSDSIVSRYAATEVKETQIQYISSSGAQWEQDFQLITTQFQATAQNAKDIQTRTFGNSLQAGAEILQNPKLFEQCIVTAEEALELLEAENCPTGVMDVLLASDQMNLQIHESIGHPLELDRILGDERNYAGWSLINQNHFGKLQFGSKLLNVVFDPHQENEFASYNFDDTGNPATYEFLIKDGLLLRGLGSLESQKRLGVSGVANARASSWNRAPIDRMANINLVPGTSTVEEMISSVQYGVLLKSNKSWSIDDYRNKFQFGCEYGQLIENGKLTRTVKNPNYRGKTLEFWNNLKAVGNPKTYETYGSPYCGKGEPSQVIRVGHGSPYCLFSNVEVFGGLS